MIPLKGLSTEPDRRFRTLSFAGACIIVLTGMIISISFGSASITFRESLTIIWSGILQRTGLSSLSTSLAGSGLSSAHTYIIWQIRLPRVVTSMIVGMALSGSGVVFQAVFRNPMADPYILGVSSGAALGVAIGMITGVLVVFPGSWGVTLFAFLGAVSASIMIHTLSGGARSSSMTLLLSGVAMNFFLSSAMSLLLYFNRDRIEDIVYWSLGSFTASNWERLAVAGPFIILSLVILLLYHRELDLLLFGDDTATSLGMNIRRDRTVLLVIATGVAAGAVSISGIIGFVGLIVPHVVRNISGPNHSRLIPWAILFGGLFTMTADTFARSLIPPTEIPVGIITSLAGAPFFIMLLRQKRREIV